MSRIAAAFAVTASLVAAPVFAAGPDMTMSDPVMVAPAPAPVGARPWARRSRYSSTPRGSIETCPSPSSAQTESVTRSRK